MKTRTYATHAATIAIAFCTGCGTDEGTFWPGSGGGGTGAGGSDGTTAGGGGEVSPTVGVSTAASGVSSPSSSGSGSGQCDPGEKMCGKSCVRLDDPNTGCGSADCSPCATPHSVAVCANEACAVGTCVGSWRDCDADQGNGCESDLLTDPYDCGACASTCAAPSAQIGACVGGKCELGKCSALHSDCDDLISNGCETNTSISKNNCGVCGHACDTAEACDNSTCVTCGRAINYGSSATSQIPTSKWLAYKYVPKLNEHVVRTCIKGGYPSTSYNVYVMSDNNGPGAVLSKSNAFHAPANGVGIACTTTGSGQLSADLIAGQTYWIASDVFSPLVNPNGEQVAYYISGSVNVDATTTWYPGTISGPPWTGSAGFIAKVVASCN